MIWTLHPVEEFTTHRGAWNQLNDHNQNIAILDAHFVAPLIKHFGSGNEKLALCGNPDTPIAMAIITPTGKGRWSTFQPSQAPLGCWLQDPEQDPLELCKSLLKSLPNLALAFSITQQDPDFLPRPGDNSDLESMNYIDTAWIDVQGSFEDYWSERSKNTRQNLRRQRNRLEREEITPRLEIITATAEVEQCVQDYGTLESAGWKSETNTAIHLENTQGRFYAEMLAKFMELGKGMVFRYWYNDQLTATDLCIRDEQRLIFLKTTYDESIRTSSPAMLMHQEAFEYVFNNRIANRIEFYGKVMEWHTKFSKLSRQLYHSSYYTQGARLAKKIVGLGRSEKA